MIEAIKSRLKELSGKSAYSFEEKKEIEALYKDVLDKTFVKTSCSNCYHDATIEMYSYLNRHNKMKEKTLYALKNGALLQLGFGKGDMITNANLTDKLAEKYLRMNPNGHIFFSKLPEDWKNRIFATKKTKKAKE